MIAYDSHDWSAFCKVRGSIFPRAILYALPSAVAAYFIKRFAWIETRADENEFDSGTIYSGFTFVLGFILVFRTSQAYLRYWQAATAVHTMRAEWFDACGSLIAFVQISKQSKEVMAHFAHTMIRLFGLLHAMALEEIASLKEDEFPLLDIEGFHKEDLRILTSEAAQGRKVEIVAQWVKVYIVKSLEEGVLNVPSPILSRVFQELGSGLVEYHKALQVVIWPFPFPYAQMSAVLIGVYMIATPLVICLWTPYSWYAFVATLTSVTCMKGIDVIAIELENPFGDDPNDLPTMTMHTMMNRDLVLLVHPDTWTIPRLEKCAKMTYQALARANREDQLSLDQYYAKHEAVVTPMLRRMHSAVFHNGLLGGTHSQSTVNSKAETQGQWLRQNFKRKRSRAFRVLKLERRGTMRSGRSTIMSDCGPGILSPLDDDSSDDSSDSPPRMRMGHQHSQFSCPAAVQRPRYSVHSILRRASESTGVGSTVLSMLGRRRTLPEVLPQPPQSTQHGGVESQDVPRGISSHSVKSELGVHSANAANGLHSEGLGADHKDGGPSGFQTSATRRESHVAPGHLGSVAKKESATDGILEAPPTIHPPRPLGDGWEEWVHEASPSPWAASLEHFSRQFQGYIEDQRRQQEKTFAEHMRLLHEVVNYKSSSLPTPAGREGRAPTPPNRLLRGEVFPLGQMPPLPPDPPAMMNLSPYGDEAGSDGLLADTMDTIMDAGIGATDSREEREVREHRRQMSAPGHFLN